MVGGIMDVNTLASKLESLYLDNFEAVIVYGSSAGSDYHEGLSDTNTIVVLRDISPTQLAKSAKIVRDWTKNNPLPLFFTREIISEACDVFPIEFSDIIDRHKVVIGNDPFEGLKISEVNLRHQCEHELRSKLLNIRSRIALLANNPKELIGLMLISSSSFFAIFRGVLRMAKQTVPTSNQLVIDQIALLSECEAHIFHEIIDVRQKLKKFEPKEALHKFEQYLTSIQSVVKFVNHFGH